MDDPRSGEDWELDRWADAILAEDAKAHGMKMPEYRRRFGLVQRQEFEDISIEPDVLSTLVNAGGAVKL